MVAGREGARCSVIEGLEAEIERILFPEKNDSHRSRYDLDIYGRFYKSTVRGAVPARYGTVQYTVKYRILYIRESTLTLHYIHTLYTFYNSNSTRYTNTR